MDITVCVGSSCHLKGSYDVIQGFRECIKRNGLEEQVTLKASFCMGYCTEGVAVKIGGQYIDGVSPENVAAIFQRYILNTARPE